MPGHPLDRDNATKEKGTSTMTTTTTPTDVSTYRWSSSDPADRFAVEDPATGEGIVIVPKNGIILDGTVI